VSFDILESYERKYIDKLIASNISFDNAHVSILLFFREFPRPASEIPELIYRFSPSLTNEKVAESINWMINNGLAILVQKSNMQILSITDECTQKIEELSKIKGLATELSITKERIKLNVNLVPLKKVSSGNNYDSMITRMKSARESIKMPMLCTPCHEATAIVLEEQAKNNVSILLLMGNDKIVNRIRGRSSKSKVKEWEKRFKGVRNVEIRTFSDEKAAQLCSSVLIDDSILRLVVYDCETMASLDGYLLEITKKNDQNINLINWFRLKFDESWLKADQINRPKIVNALIQEFNFVLLFDSVLIYMYFYVPMNELFSKFFVVGITLCSQNLLKRIWENYRSIFIKLYSAMKSI